MILFLPRPLFSIFISIWYNTIFLFPISSSTTFCVLHLLSFYICFLFFYFFLLSDYFGSRDPKTKRNEEQKKLNGDLQWMHKCSEFIFFYNHHLLVTRGELGIFIYSSIIKNYFAHTISSHSDFLIIQKTHFWYRTNNTLCMLYPHYHEFYQVKQKKQPSLSFTTPFFLSFFFFPYFCTYRSKKKPLSNTTLYKYNTYNGAFLNNNTIRICKFHHVHQLHHFLTAYLKRLTSLFFFSSSFYLSLVVLNCQTTFFFIKKNKITFNQPMCYECFALSKSLLQMN